MYDVNKGIDRCLEFVDGNAKRSSNYNELSVTDIVSNLIYEGTNISLFVELVNSLFDEQCKFVVDGNFRSVNGRIYNNSGAILLEEQVLFYVGYNNIGSLSFIGFGNHYKDGFSKIVLFTVACTLYDCQNSITNED